MPVFESRPSRTDESIRVGLFLLLLTLVGLAAYTPWFGLVGDDWWFFAHLSDGQFSTTLLHENPQRPPIPYMCTCGNLPFSLPEGWKPARDPINLDYTPSPATASGSAYLAWREFLLSQLDFASAVALP